MSKIFIHLQRVHDTVHDFHLLNYKKLLIKKNFSIPKISTGGVVINNWSKFSEQEKKKALSKNWYIYYSYRDSVTGQLTRMPNIKAGANRFKNKTDRYNYLKTLRDALEFLLEKGFNPYQDNHELELLEIQPEEIQKVIKVEPLPIINEITKPQIVENQIEENLENIPTIKEAFDIALKIKKVQLVTLLTKILS
ncbi:hypothetical protein OX283_012595 [Flavobacterium sp. SUN052]|uniref:hypothetical protein n=1 Tax=Flavobacterium sp. SUN052 TaxID=3002441 RepID=UPI00237E97ED|nr:hypothetical protein [Flavobacterium sp. SUN052]MEC4005501.1 hypothetical protein [Flavobacterium sp. SUN052]